MTSAYYCSTMGWLRISADGQGAFLLDFERKKPKRFSRPEPVVKQALREIDEYFKGRRRKFSIRQRFDGSPFQQKVWKALCSIPYGTTWSYKELAHYIGRPNAVRAVGAAVGKNKLPIFIPCHRVIRHDGRLGGYRGGVAKKQRLLHLETGLSSPKSFIGDQSYRVDSRFRGNDTKVKRK